VSDLRSGPATRHDIATNLLRRRRVERRQLTAYARTDWIVYQDDTAVAGDESTNGAALARALALMKPPERDALLLYALVELSYDEIATALDAPVGTVATWLHRARGAAQREPATADTVPLATTGAKGDGSAEPLSGFNS
jgi:DNA-directed RNA polymerase specialized sigma24 family protein